MIWLLPWDEDNTARHVHFAVYAMFGIWARMHGVVKRYEALPDGYFWFGYCSRQLETEHQLQRAKLAKRERLLQEARPARDIRR